MRRKIFLCIFIILCFIWSCGQVSVEVRSVTTIVSGSNIEDYYVLETNMIYIPDRLLAYYIVNEYVNNQLIGEMAPEKKEDRADKICINVEKKILGFVIVEKEDLEIQCELIEGDDQKYIWTIK